MNNINSFSVIGLLLVAGTLIVSFIKWRTTRDNGFLFLPICLVVVPLIYHVSEIQVEKAAKTALETGQATFLWWRLAWEKGTRTTANGAINASEFLSSFRYVGLLVTESMPLAIVFLLTRAPTIFTNKRVPDSALKIPPAD